MTAPASIPCVGFSDSNGIGGFLILMGPGSDARHQVDHVYFWTGQQVIQSFYGAGVAEEDWSAFDQGQHTNIILFAPPEGVNLAPAFVWAGKCLGQKYDMRRNVLDGLWALLGVFHLAGPSSPYNPNRFRGKLSPVIPQPGDCRAKNCVELVVQALQAAGVPGCWELALDMTPAQVMAWCERRGWKRIQG